MNTFDDEQRRCVFVKGDQSDFDNTHMHVSSSMCTWVLYNAPVKRPSIGFAFGAVTSCIQGYFLIMFILPNFYTFKLLCPVLDLPKHGFVSF